MKFCPECGNILKDKIIDEKVIKACNCGFIDWDNWVNIGVVVVAYNENNEFAMVTLKGEEENKITFPGGYRGLGESLEQAAEREFFEETGHKVNNLELFKVYTNDEKRLIWVVFKGKIGEGTFIENSETKEIQFYSVENPPNKKKLRGPLTESLLSDVIN